MQDKQKLVEQGVEQIEDAKWLEEFDCDYGQGYLYDQALTIEDFEKKYIKPTKK